MNLPKPLVFDDVLDPNVFTALRGALVAAPPMRQSAWLSPERPPQNLVESVVRALQDLVDPHRTFAGAEWWVRRESAGVQKPLHFDKDEALALKGRFVHPRRGSVFYLTTAGGDTLITDQRCSDNGRKLIPKVATEILAVSPRENRYMVFDGRLHHGVRRKLTDVDSIRMTLLVNWWASPPSNVDDLTRSAYECGLPRGPADVVANGHAVRGPAVRRCRVVSDHAAAATTTA